ncbi:MAG: hypothetical protein N3A64_03335 [Desulfobacterota bacterium]|nr:hypothetical protein [Thermodesulfobacteriota bacterium]
MIREDELVQLIANYFHGQEKEKIFDEVKATGEVELIIPDENEKANWIFEFAEKINIPRHSVAHVGDTMGDSGGIVEVARNGGLGVAFNYNQALKNYLERILKQESFPGKIILAEPKKDTSRLQNLLSVLWPYLP